MEKKNCSNIKFEYIDCAKYKKITDRCGSLFRLVLFKFYLDKWFKKVVNTIKNRQNAFDIIYRVTPNSYRAVPDLSDIVGTIKIMGPVGGAQEIPNQLRSVEKGKFKLLEIFHRLSNNFILKSSSFRKKINTFDMILCCNQETYNSLKPIYDHKLVIYSDVGIEDKELGKEKEKNTIHNPVRLLWIGRYMFRKGLDLLIDSLASIKNENFILTMVGDGEYKNKILSKVKKLSLQDKIVFVNRVPKNIIYKYYLESDFFCFPSFRESSGNVLLESLTYGVPVIALNFGGASAILEKSSCELIDLDGIKNYNDAVKKYSESVKKMLNLDVISYENLVKCCKKNANNYL